MAGEQEIRADERRTVADLLDAHGEMLTTFATTPADLLGLVSYLLRMDGGTVAVSSVAAPSTVVSVYGCEVDGCLFSSVSSQGLATHRSRKHGTTIGPVRFDPDTARARAADAI